jgi:hypothetical protein
VTDAVTQFPLSADNHHLPPLMEDTEPQHVVNQGILEFRTITSILETLQDPSLDSEPSHGNPSFQMLIRDIESDSRTDDHRMLDALATLLATNNDIVAVTTKAGTLFSSPMMDIVACSTGHRSNSRSLAGTASSSFPEALEGKLPVIVAEIRTNVSETHDSLSRISIGTVRY